jgi:tetratricopeptide (TPR) repeat protein
VGKLKSNFNKNNLSIIIIITVLLFCSFGFKYLRDGCLFNDSGYSRKIYSEALKLKQDQNYKEAYQILNKISQRYVAYDAVLFQQADCAAKNGDESTAIKKYKAILSDYSGSIFAEQAKYELAKAYLRAKEDKKAEKVFKSIISKNSNTDFTIGSYYYLGQIIQKENLSKAVKYWKKYIELSPDGRFSSDCAGAIIKSGKYLNLKEKLQLGIALYNSGEYEKAVYFLKQTSLKESWYYLAMSYKCLDYKKQTLDTLKVGIDYYTYTIPKTDLTNALLTYAKLYKGTPEETWKEIALIAKGKINAEDFALYKLSFWQPKDKAINLYHKIYANYPNGDYASEALWNIFWNEYTSKNYQNAMAIIKKHVSKYPNTIAAPKVLFWTGKLLEKQQEISQAKGYYSKIIEKFPDDYYAFRATGRLKALSGGSDVGWITNKEHFLSNNFKLKLPYSYNDLVQKFGRTVAELFMVEDYELISSFNGFDDDFLNSWIKYKGGLKSKSIVIARNNLDKTVKKPIVNDIRWKYIYPLYFQDQINKYAKENDLDPYIVLALTREESYFNNMAVSSSNARGLMQLLPSTASDIAKWENLGYVNELMLFNPETNIKFGSAYISYNKEKLYGNMVFAVGAYNGGPAAIRRWLKTLSYSDLDEFIESIPYEQTRTYIKKVYKSYWNYNKIYNNSSSF